MYFLLLLKKSDILNKRYFFLEKKPFLKKMQCLRQAPNCFFQLCVITIRNKTYKIQIAVTTYVANGQLMLLSHQFWIYMFVVIKHIPPVITFY